MKQINNYIIEKLKISKNIEYDEKDDYVLFFAGGYKNKYMSSTKYKKLHVEDDTLYNWVYLVPKYDITNLFKKIKKLKGPGSFYELPKQYKLKDITEFEFFDYDRHKLPPFNIYINRIL